ncbi:MAG: DUF421 domain-containing protein [Nitrospirales bacterium]|nr:DUF421 domain-containing protein [Nitrospirales bacterium]MBA3966939.1 DUF421 domain-containing protein [Nitrospirales bacterium]
MEHIFFDNWQALGRTGLISVLAYVSLIALLRLFGKRTLSKMNAFDFVVTVALGSILATILLNKDVTLAQGVLALALLIGMQFIVTWTSLRIRWVRKLATGEPTLLLYQGRFLSDALRWTRVTEDEVRAAVRGAGMATLGEVKAVVLETDGSFSVVRGDEGSGESGLIGVRLPSDVTPTTSKN